MRSEMLKKIHASHIGIEGSLRQAREILYWPGMTTAIRDHVSACGTSIPFAWNNPKSPSCHRKYPTGPGQRLLWIYLHWIRPSISSSWMTTPISLSHEPCLIRELHQLLLVWNRSLADMVFPMSSEVIMVPNSPHLISKHSLENGTSSISPLLHTMLDLAEKLRKQLTRPNESTRKQRSTTRIPTSLYSTGVILRPEGSIRRQYRSWWGGEQGLSSQLQQDCWSSSFQNPPRIF